MRKYSIAVVRGLAFAAGLSWGAEAAQADITFIRDAETEAVIAEYASPLFAAGGLDPKAVYVYIIHDDSINAFVAGGMNLFIYTGLLLKAESPNQISGVIAHETGHILGGHLVRAREAVRNATIQAMVACILGVGGAAASGEGAAAGVCQLGQQIAGRTLLNYSRTQESAADQAGLALLQATGQSPRGTVQFLKILEKQEALQVGLQDPYLRSHPLSDDRIEAATFSLEHSPFADQVDSPEAMARFNRMKAKLRGYAEAQRLQTYYKAGDNSLEARYARVVAYHYRLGQPDKALALLDGLLAEHPDDPYFQELKGEILLQKGQAKAALPFYAQAVEAVPDAALLRLGYGRALSQTEDPALRKTAIAQLEEAVRLEPKYRDGWYWLAIAYGADGRLGQMALALAEEAAAGGGPQADRRAKGQAQRAMGILPEGSPGWLRAQDIFNQMDRDVD